MEAIGAGLGVTVLDSDYKDAILDVESELGPDLYALAPKADYLIADPALIDAASMLLGFVLAGMTEGIGKGIATWGKDAGESLVLRIRGLFTREPGARTNQEALQDAEDQVKAAVEEFHRQSREAALNEDLDTVVDELVRTLVASGMVPSGARRYGETVRQSTITLLEGAAR